MLDAITGENHQGFGFDSHWLHCVLKKGENFMSKEIIEVLDALSERLGMSIDWTQNNIIPYLQEICDKYVNYEIATSIVWIVVGIILLIVAVLVIKKLNTDNDLEDDDIFLLIIVTAVCGITGIWIVLTQVFDIVTCYTFPEKIIIEKLIQIKKNMN